MTAVLLAVLAWGAACGDDDAGEAGGATTSRTPAPAPATRVNSTATAPARTPTAGGVSEVTGIAGSVNEGAGVIEINRLSGAEVRRITVDGGTVIRRATGGRIALRDVRPSDRIIAQGRVGVDGVLAATAITVQPVSPGGGGPGG